MGGWSRLAGHDVVVVIGLHEGIQVLAAIVLWRSGGIQVLALEFAVDQVFLAHAGLTPGNDFVHVWCGDTGEFGNTAGHQESTGKVFGKVPVGKVPVNFSLGSEDFHQLAVLDNAIGTLCFLSFKLQDKLIFSSIWLHFN